MPAATKTVASEEPPYTHSRHIERLARKGWREGTKDMPSEPGKRIPYDKLKHFIPKKRRR